MQADAGAQVVQIFDSWASELQPQDFDVFAGPYIQKIIDSVRQTHPDLAIILYISGSGGLLERMAACKPDVVSVDQRVDMEDAIRRIGSSFAVQVGCLKYPVVTAFPFSRKESTRILEMGGIDDASSITIPAMFVSNCHEFLAKILDLQKTRF